MPAPDDRSHFLNVRVPADLMTRLRLAAKREANPHGRPVFRHTAQPPASAARSDHLHVLRSARRRHRRQGALRAEKRFGGACPSTHPAAVRARVCTAPPLACIRGPIWSTPSAC